MAPILRTTPIEELVEVPGAVSFMIHHGLPCLVCGEPAWGTFEDVARDAGKSNEEIDSLLEEMNRMTGGREQRPGV